MNTYSEDILLRRFAGALREQILDAVKPRKAYDVVWGAIYSRVAAYNRSVCNKSLVYRVDKLK